MADGSKQETLLFKPTQEYHSEGQTWEHNGKLWECRRCNLLCGGNLFNSQVKSGGRKCCRSLACEHENSRRAASRRRGQVVQPAGEPPAAVDERALDPLGGVGQDQQHGPTISGPTAAVSGGLDAQPAGVPGAGVTSNLRTVKPTLIRCGDFSVPLRFVEPCIGDNAIPTDVVDEVGFERLLYHLVNDPAGTEYRKALYQSHRKCDNGLKDCDCVANPTVINAGVREVYMCGLRSKRLCDWALSLINPNTGQPFRVSWDKYLSAAREVFGRALVRGGVPEQLLPYIEYSAESILENAVTRSLTAMGIEITAAPSNKPQAPHADVGRLAAQMVTALFDDTAPTRYFTGEYRDADDETLRPYIDDNRNPPVRATPLFSMRHGHSLNTGQLQLGLTTFPHLTHTSPPVAH